MAEEFNLSEKAYREGTCLLTEDVKEFIKRLKDMISKYHGFNNRTRSRLSIIKRIDKLAGKELI